MPPRLACCTLASLVAVVALTANHLHAQQTQVPGAIRTGITMVPLDVRVLDRDRRPVTDLRQEDFTILENGVPQPIRHFSTSALTPGVPDRDARPGFGAPTRAPARRRPRATIASS